MARTKFWMWLALPVVAACSDANPVALTDQNGPAAGRIGTASVERNVFEAAPGHYYEVVKHELGLRQATDAAASRSWNGIAGRLATVGSAEEAQLIASFLTQSGQWYFLGGRYADAGRWEWITGETFAYTAWRNGTEPTDYLTRAAVIVYSEPGASTHGLWWRGMHNFKADGYIVEYQAAN